MKRLNPQTNEPFIRGHIREDGYVFYSYRKEIIRKKTGYYKETWLIKEKFDTLVLKGLQATKIYSSTRIGKKIRNKARDKYRLTPNGRARILLDGAKGRCKKYGGVLTITHEWILNKLQKGLCEVTNIPFEYEIDNRFFQNPYAPSLDRIDSKNRDYSPTNTRVVLVAVNTALSEFGMEIMKPIMEKLVKY